MRGDKLTPLERKQQGGLDKQMWFKKKEKKVKPKPLKVGKMEHINITAEFKFKPGAYGRRADKIVFHEFGGWDMPKFGITPGEHIKIPPTPFGEHGIITRYNIVRKETEISLDGGKTWTVKQDSPEGEREFHHVKQIRERIRGMSQPQRDHTAKRLLHEYGIKMTPDIARALGLREDPPFPKEWDVDWRVTVEPEIAKDTRTDGEKWADKWAKDNA